MKPVDVQYGSFFKSLLPQGKSTWSKLTLTSSNQTMAQLYFEYFIQKRYTLPMESIEGNFGSNQGFAIAVS